MASYRVTELAEQDLLEIWQYTAAHWNVEQAEHLNWLFHQRFVSLAYQPFQGRPRPELGPDYRSVPLYKLPHHLSTCRLWCANSSRGTRKTSPGIFVPALETARHWEAHRC